MIGSTQATKFFTLLAALGLCCTLSASAQTTVQVTASWEAPTTGSPVVRYALQLSTDGESTWTTASSTIEGTSHILDLEFDTTYVARVAGIDAQDRQGPWSETSDPYTPTIDIGPPGEPGRPVLIL